MQITTNSTGMLAGLSVAADVSARDYCVVVVKGTFVIQPSGELQLAEEQLPLVLVDEHEGDPDSSCVRAECDFALVKPFTDVLLQGRAVAPGERAVTEMTVSLEVISAAGVRNKSARVTGDRVWERSLGRVCPSAPEPFTQLPLSFDRAFGGADDSRGPDQVQVERYNLLGQGLNVSRSASQIEGRALPNLEHPDHLMHHPSDRPPVHGFGVVGRAWQPRADFAGTYDECWRDERCPYLPDDFDPRYFQAAPADQQYAHFQGGERIRCVHMAPQPVVEFLIPRIHVPVKFCFIEHELSEEGVLDTVILEPHLGRAQLLWRTRAQLPKKLNQLREVQVGAPLDPVIEGPVGYRNGKPRFRSLAVAIRWLRSRRSR